MQYRWQLLPLFPLSKMLIPSTPAVPTCCCSKGPAPYWSNSPLLISDIRAAGTLVVSPHSGAQRQSNRISKKIKMVSKCFSKAPHIEKSQSADSWFTKEMSLQLSSKQSIADVWIAQLDRKRVTQVRSSGCKSSVAVTAVCSWHLRPHHCSRIPANSRTFNLNFQNFPRPNHFPGLFRPGNFTKKNPGLSRKMETL